ncbi:MAG TPA: VOC family protein [Microlunatus sp.]|nr:VOC family protein [Microlunatus sp.]
MEWKIELILVPVTDVDRARDFWAALGWNVDHDVTVSEDVRFVQLTPPGSACSIALGRGVSPMEPGTLDAVQLVIPDADRALELLTDRGVATEGVDDQAWGRFVTFRDPDGNRFTLQQLPVRG